jgi:ferrous iron transport protein A
VKYVEEITLNDMPVGESGVVVKIRGGALTTSRLSTLGIKIGQRIKKITQQAMQGPVIVEVGKTQIAIGFGMANNILLKRDNTG